MASAGGVVREILSIITSERAKIESAVESYKAQYESQISSLEESMSDTVLSYENTYKDLSCMRAPLHMAAKLGMVQIAKALLDSGADVNMPCMIGDQAQYNATPFAISLPYQDALKALRAAQITMLTDPKAEFADFELLQKITGTPMLLAADAVQTPMIMLLIVAGGHFTPLCATVYSRKLTEMLESMVAAGASPEEYPNPFDLLKWVVNSATKNTVAYSAPLASDKPVAYHETVAHYETLAPHKSVAFHESLIEAFDSLLSLKNVMAHLDAPEGETMFRDICLDAELSEHYVAIGGVSVAHDLAA